MEDEDQARTAEDNLEEQHLDEEENVVTFLDSLDAYLTLIDSLSSTIRQVEMWPQLDLTFFSIYHPYLFDSDHLNLGNHSEFENFVEFRIFCWFFIFIF